MNLNPLKALWYRLFRDPEPYAPEFADCPTAVEYLRSGIALHADAEDKGGIEEEVGAVGVCAAGLRVAGMNTTEVNAELAAMVKAGGLRDLWSAPARLEAFYLVPEEQR